MRVHLIGVAGAGMAPLAGLLRRAGHEVSGSDVAFDPPMGPQLEAWGVATMRGWDASHLDGLGKDDAVVVGNVCRRDHPLADEAEKRGLRRISMPTALRELVFEQSRFGCPPEGPPRKRPVVAVCGTHGKTTTTALLAAMLASAGLEPGYLIGGVPIDRIGDTANPSPFAIGRTTRSLAAPLPFAPFVIEGDEYDSAFFEKQPKAWGYAPTIALLTSIEHDHVDVYPDVESYRRAFAGILERLPSEADGGLLVANAADEEVAALVARVAPKCRVVWYAASDVAARAFPSGTMRAEPPTWTAHEVGLFGGVGDERSSIPENESATRGSGFALGYDVVQPFDLFVGPTSAGRFHLGVFGVHNVSNAVGALAIAAEAFGVRVRDVASAMANFHGVQRRQERLLDGPGVVLYDDFAHHPTAVDATLRSIRARHRRAKLVAVYEPRSATACRAMHQRAYVSSFDAADAIVLAPLGRSTIAKDERLDLERLAADLRAKGKDVETCASIDDVVPAVLARATPGAVVVAMSNGAFGGVTAALRERLA